MEFTVKLKKTKQFYPTFKDWCETKDFPVIALENMGEYTFVCYKDGIPIYSCSLWDTNSMMCLVGFPVSNPNEPYYLKEGGLNFLFERIGIMLKARGYNLAWTISGTERIIESLEKNGFNLADKNINQYIKVL